MSTVACQDAFWPFWPLDRTGDALWLGVDLDKREGLGSWEWRPLAIFSMKLSNRVEQSYVD